jgi:hypothetical protein
VKEIQALTMFERESTTTTQNKNTSTTVKAEIQHRKTQKNKIKENSLK